MRSTLWTQDMLLLADFHQQIHLQAYRGRLQTPQGHFCFLWVICWIYTCAYTHTCTLSLSLSLSLSLTPSCHEVQFRTSLLESYTLWAKEERAGLGKTWGSAWPLQTEAPQFVSVGINSDQNLAELKRQSVPLVQSEQHAGPRALGLGDATESDRVRACAGCSPVMDGTGVATTHRCHINKHRWLNVDEVPYNHSHGIHRGAELALWLRGLNLIADSN